MSIEYYYSFCRFFLLWIPNIWQLGVRIMCTFIYSCVKVGPASKLAVCQVVKFCRTDTHTNCAGGCICSKALYLKLCTSFSFVEEEEEDDQNNSSQSWIKLPAVLREVEECDWLIGWLVGATRRIGWRIIFWMSHVDWFLVHTVLFFIFITFWGL